MYYLLLKRGIIKHILYQDELRKCQQVEETTKDAIAMDVKDALKELEEAIDVTTFHREIWERQLYEQKNDHHGQASLTHGRKTDKVRGVKLAREGQQ